MQHLQKVRTSLVQKVFKEFLKNIFIATSCYLQQTTLRMVAM